ncbi:GNAT family N-acetyltransferase [Kribbella sp. NPDC051620]|uniref:GNAT family N-acetyltransferase n=1 Tax=Kribbella sp. NPDC051620 TaxID=3364120 RepID=UPI00379E3338
MTELHLPPSAAVASRLAAGDAAVTAGVDIRPLTSLHDLDRAYRLFDAIWNPEPSEPPVTTGLLRALVKAGNYVAGAFDGDVLVGACMGFFSEPRTEALHSHITGVAESARGRNVGLALKVHQRAWAMERGISSIHWTFDPLVRRNAYFNLTKLGAVASEYLSNFYGTMRDSLNSGQDSDRLLVRWELASWTPEAGSRINADPSDGQTAGAPFALSQSQTGRPKLGDLAAAQVLVAVPADIDKLRIVDPRAVGEWRMAVREVLGTLMAEGARVIGFDRTGYYVVDRTGSGRKPR